MNQKRIKSLIILGVWSAYVLFLLIFYKQAISIMATSNLFSSLFLYLFYNPAYILLLYSSYVMSARFGKNILKRILASVMLVISFDFVAMPRFSYYSDIALNLSASSVSNFGVIIVNNLDKFLPHIISFSLYYVVFPIVAFAISMELMGVIDFIKNMKGGRI